MSSKEYIISQLNLFIHEFPQTRVRYEYDALSDTHFIEVVPNEVYHLNEKYIQWECDMYDNFIELFPYECLGFISDDAVIGLENIDYELRGVNYDLPISTGNERIIVEEKNIEIFQNKITTSYNTITYNHEIGNSTSINSTTNIPFNDKFSILPIAS